MKYSKNFERDYQFYYNNRHHFKFCGTLLPKFKAIFSKNGVSAKKSFYNIDSNGKNIPTCEPYLLDDLLLCKASVNFMIKQWNEGYKKGLLTKIEINNTLDNNDYLLVWLNNGKHYYFKDMKTYYNLPDWVIKAIINQK